MGRIIGIDLGTTKSVVSVMEAGQPIVIPNQEGARATPSVVAVAKSGEWLVGEAAMRQSITNPDQTVFSIKRFMGRHYDGVSEAMKTVPYRVVRGNDGRAHVEISGHKYSPSEIASKIFKKIKGAVEGYLGEEVTEAVITVPAAFNEFQRQVTRDAARIAGIEAIRILNEPNAAALAHGLNEMTSKTIAVYDFGGGNFSVSILEIGDGVVEVKSSAGNTMLGGDDIDQHIVNWIISEFRKEYGVNLTTNTMVSRRLKEAAERAKIDLSTQLVTDINLPSITTDSTGPKHLLLTLTRSNFEQICEDIFQDSIGPCRQAMKDASWSGTAPIEIDEVLLIGGSSRIPRIHAIVAEFFKREPNKRLNPDEAVAAGAAVHAGIWNGEVKEVFCLDATSLSLGIETLGGVFTKIIERNATFPTRRSESFTTAEDYQTSVEIRAFQGERAMAKDNLLLKRFTICDILPAPRGIPQIEVTFHIDSIGIISITAENRGTGAVDPDQLCLTGYDTCSCP